jgi:hypothetical protein
MYLVIIDLVYLLKKVPDMFFMENQSGTLAYFSDSLNAPKSGRTNPLRMART